MKPDAVPPPQSSRILIVDDEQGLRDFFIYELTALGYEVVAVGDGARALELARASRFDLVISDVRMPRMDGLELLKELKKACPETEVVMTTGYGTVDVAVEAMKLGAFDFLLKPVGTAQLTSLVRRAVETSELKSLLGIYESSLAQFRSAELDEILPLIASLSKRVLAADRTVILLLEDGRLRTAADSDPAADDVDFAALIAGGGAADRPALSQTLTAGTEVYGYLTAVRARNAEPFCARDVRHAAVFAAQAAQAVRNAEMFRRFFTTQQLLLQSEKLNTAGSLAAGIAHEINNPLTVILGSVELLRANPALAAKDKEDLETIAAQAVRCRDVVASLLDFARRREPRKENVELVALLESSLTLARFAVKFAPEVRCDWPAVSPRVNADPVQLKQVAVNLLRNAFQAIEGRENSHATLRVREADGRAIFSVEDNGAGIAQKDMERIFKPFFTTKEPGQGTGLGLYLCRLLIERNDGRISAANRPEGGAVFTVDLPALP
ncbi:MAG: response regulator [Elusimicrobia bacterium]|nr:response regulator [Elusimicrobiota bacterium]